MSLIARRYPAAMNVTNSEKILKNYCKAKGYEKPVYRITSRTSALIDGRVYRFKHYLCTVSVNGFNLAEGDGFSKRIARKKAAMFGLQHLRVFELQNFMEVYRTILPQGLLKDVPTESIPNLTGNKKLMVTASAVEIEELTGGILTPQSVLLGGGCDGDGGQLPNRKLGEVELKKSSTRERSHSADSNLLMAAIEKLRNYQDSDDAGWERKEIEEKTLEEKKQKSQSMFGEDELRLFNEKPHHSESDIQEIIAEVTHEIETIEENGQDDLDL